jgi:hypothetical protein
MKKYLCKVYSTDEYSSVSYAYVEIGEGLKMFVAAVLEAVKPVAGREDFLRVEFLNYLPIFLEGLPEVFEEYMDALGSGGVVELPGSARKPEGKVRLAFSTIHIEEDGIRWTCQEKHSSCDNETATFYYNDIGWPELVRSAKR